MWGYVIRRVLGAIPFLILITAVIFYLLFALGAPSWGLENTNLVSPEEKAQLVRLYGLDKPRYLQYLYWLRTIVSGRWGYSFHTGQPVLDLVGSHLENTLILMTTAFLLTMAISLPLGVLSAVRRYSALDHLTTVLAFAFQSTPAYVISFALIWLFAVKLKSWGLPALPPGQMYNLLRGPSPLETAKHIVLPALSIALPSAAIYIRYLRASVLEELGQDYVRTAKAKGLGEGLIVRRHVLRNSGLAVVTVAAMHIPLLFTGAFIVENAFSWPGMGLLFVQAVDATDYPVMMDVLAMTSALVVLFNLLADLSYALLDPRISYG